MSTDSPSTATPQLPWLEPQPYSGTVESQREYALAIGRALRGEARVWLASQARPQLIGKLRHPSGSGHSEHSGHAHAGSELSDSQALAHETSRTQPCAGCTCSLATDAVPDPDPSQIALVVPTSGSTGAPKSVAHSVQTLKASIHATAYALEAHGAWLPLLPPTHIAGVQVIARAFVASELLGLDEQDGLPGALAPLVDLSGHFEASTVVAQLAAWDARVAQNPELASLPLFTSVVPTQLERIVTAAERGEDSVKRALSRFEAILVGGAPSTRELRERAGALGARIVTTYGSSETAGGCVYNGEPLQGVELKVSDDDRLMITAPSIALGYIYETGAFTHIEGNDIQTRKQFFTVPSLAKTRVFLTSDLARLDFDPARSAQSLRILGRADDVIISGGRKIVPQAIESVLADSGEFAASLVVGVPHSEWGEQAVALIVPKLQGAVPTQTWRADLATQLTMTTAITAAGLERYMIPRVALTIGELPLLESGKVDRAQATEVAVETLLNIEAFDYAKTLGTRFSNGEHHELEFGGMDDEEN